MNVNAKAILAAGWCGVLLACGAGCTAEMLADADDLKQFPLPASIPGDPPGSGLRYWGQSFVRLPYTARHDGNSYVTVILPPGGGVEFWANEWGEGAPRSGRCSCVAGRRWSIWVNRRRCSTAR